MNIFFEHGTHLFFILILLGLSGFISGSETALFSLGVADLNRLREKSGPVNRAILSLQARLPDVLMTILLCNMVINILIFATSTVIGSKLGAGEAVVFGIVCLILVIVCGEVIPKLVATVARVAFCRLTVLPLLALHKGVSPLRYGLGGLVTLIERMVGIAAPGSSLNAEELDLLIRVSRDDGTISTNEHDLIREVLELPEIRVREMMTPRVDVATINPGASADEIIAAAQAAGHSKVIVREPGTGEFIGWVNANEILLADPAAVVPLSIPVHQAVVVSELDRADQAFGVLRETGAKLAIVVDERGSTAGLLALTDIIEEIFGELPDEAQTAEQPIRKDGERAYWLAGNVSVRNWRDTFDVLQKLPSVTTMGGLVTTILGRTPQVGDVVTLGNMQLVVTRIFKRRVQEIRLTLIDAPADALDSSDSSSGGRR